MEAGKRAPHTQTPPWSATGQVPAFHLAALLRVRRWSRWSRLYGVWVPGAAQPSRWLLRTIWLGYAIQFVRRPPKFRGIHLTSHVMVPVPPANMKAGFFSPYFIVPKKSGGLRPILGLRILMLKMLMQNRVFGCIRPQVRSAALTWRPVLPCVDPSVPQAIPVVCVQRTSISVQVLPFGLSLSPRVFTKVAEAALVPLREQGVRILNYLDDWLILRLSLRISNANTGIGALAPQPVGHSGQLGKEQTLADAEDLFSRYGVWIRSIRQRASRRNALSRCWTAWIRSRTGRRHHWNKFQRLLGHMAAAAAVTPLGLLHMRPLQHWLHGRVPRWAWQSGCARRLNPPRPPLYTLLGPVLSA